jgi:hypothetical protein
MDDLEKIILAVFGGIITLAIVSVFVGRNSRAPDVISASGAFLSNIVAAAVAPINTASTNGNLGANMFSNPSRN